MDLRCGACDKKLAGSYSTETVEYRHRALEVAPDGRSIDHSIASGVFCSVQHLIEHLVGVESTPVPGTEDPF